MKIDRRNFMGRTAGVIAASAWAASSGAQDVAPKLTATTMRMLGNTGLQCTLLGMGTGVKAWAGQSALTRLGRAKALAVIAHAYERGLRYFDTADQYGAHAYFKYVMQHGPVERDKIIINTKTNSTDAALVRLDIERFRKELDTDRLDIVMIHCMTEADWPEKHAACLDVLEDAKQKGIIRAHGVSCHSVEALGRAADLPWVDVVLARINPFGVKMDGPAEQVVPLIQRAHDNGKGVLGMKIVGEGQIADKIAESIKFALNLGTIDAMPIGFLSPDEVDSAIAHIAAAG